VPFGAEEKNNLEPLSAISVLEALEDWATVLKTESEALHVLDELATPGSLALKGNELTDDTSSATKPQRKLEVEL